MPSEYAQEMSNVNPCAIDRLVCHLQMDLTCRMIVVFESLVSVHDIQPLRLASLLVVVCILEPVPLEACYDDCSLPSMEC